MKLYTKQNCPNCMIIKSLLTKGGLIDQFDIIEDVEEVRAAAKTLDINGVLPFAEIGGQGYNLPQLKGWIDTQ